MSAATTERKLPLLTALNEFFWTCGRGGQLQILRCDDCEQWLHPPSPVCPRCLSRNLTPQPVSGFGKIETFTVNYQAWTPGLETPYIIAIVSLDESCDVRLTTNIVGTDVGTVRIDQRVRVAFEQHDDVWLPLFTPL